VLDNYYTYSVGFKYWENFASDVYVEDLEAQASLTEGNRNWASLLVNLLVHSFWTSLVRSGEIAELAVLETVFNGVVNCFGFTYAVVSSSECDVQVIEQTTSFFSWKAKRPAICRAALRIAHNYGPSFVSLGLPRKSPAHSHSTKWNGKVSPKG
jgi:hypothetical protein